MPGADPLRAALRVRPAGRTVREGLPQHGDGVLPDCWQVVQWPPGHDEPSDYWLSDLPADTPLTDLVHLAKSRWRIEHDYRELKTGLGPTTSKAVPSSAGTATSPSPPPLNCSSPNYDSPTQKQQGSPESLRRPTHLQYQLGTWLGFCPTATNPSLPKKSH